MRISLLPYIPLDPLTEHYDPKPLIIVERFHFHKRDQAPGETIAEYVAELRRLAAKCAFGAYLDEALRDRLVCGLQNEQIQRGLLSEADLDLEKAVKRATAMDVAQSQAQAMKAPQQVVERVDTTPGRAVARSAGARCSRCGNSGHRESECRFKNSTCHRCGKRGHISRVCKATAGGRGARGRFQTRPSAYQPRLTR